MSKEGSVPEKPKRKFAGWIVMLIVIVAGAAYGLHLYHVSQTREVTDNAQFDATIASVSARVGGQVVEVLVDSNDEVQKGQLLFSLDRSDYETRVEQLKSALEVARRKVAQARLRVQVARRESEAQIVQSGSAVEVSRQGVSAARQAVEVARAEAQKSVTGIEQAEADVAESKAKLTRAQAESRRLHDDVDRYALLFSKREVSQQRFEEIKTQAAQADAEVEATRQTIRAREALVRSAQSNREVALENVDKARAQTAEMEARVGEAHGRYQQAEATQTQIAVAEADVEVAKAEVLRVEAELKEAELKLSYTKIYAPMSGRVTHKNVEVGQQVEAGRPALALVDDTDLWVVANFKETQMERIQVGQKVGLAVDTYPGEELEGSIESIQAGTGAVFSLLPPENASGNFVKVVQRIPVKITLSKEEQQKHRLRPGMSVEATVWLQ
ncbi:MAG: HlyD family secretion protein [Candidatus Eremiobacteraeota bacterium]|nr:HlyD family secretion protein [Candidatus Eremiobacteraeota bacterium]